MLSELQLNPEPVCTDGRKVTILYLAVICHHIRLSWHFFFFIVCHSDKVLCVQPSGEICLSPPLLHHGCYNTE